MDNKEHYVYETLATIYERSLDEASNIISRAQNPLTALCIIIAILLFIAQSVISSPIPRIRLENATIIGGFYISLGWTLILVINSFYYLWKGFKAGGFKYEPVGSPEDIEILLNSSEDEKELLRTLIHEYKNASEHNIKKNKKRMEYIRIAMEKIIMAVAFCFFTVVLFCVITALK